MVNKKSHHIGYFLTIEEAKAAYAEASQRLQGQFSVVKSRDDLAAWQKLEAA